MSQWHVTIRDGDLPDEMQTAAAANNTQPLDYLKQRLRNIAADTDDIPDGNLAAALANAVHNTSKIHTDSTDDELPRTESGSFDLRQETK